MSICVDIVKTVFSGRRTFSLKASFKSDENFCVLFGPSGAGKSLTLQCIAGMMSPDNGRIELDGRVLFDSENKINLPIRERGVGYLFQDYALFPHLSVAENVGFGLRKWWQRRLDRQDGRRVREFLKIFELETVADSLPRDISGGQRQRTALARALIEKPDVLLLDEPFSALDQMLRARMREELIAVRRRFDIPAILITHDPADVEAFGETLVEYDGGRCVRVSSYRQMRGMGAAGAKAKSVLLAGEKV